MSNESMEKSGFVEVVTVDMKQQKDMAIWCVGQGRAHRDAQKGSRWLGPTGFPQYCEACWRTLQSSSSRQAGRDANWVSELLFMSDIFWYN